MKQAVATLLFAGNKGMLTTAETVSINGGRPQEIKKRVFRFKIRDVRSQDFIVELSNGKTMYCKLPQNKRDGSEEYDVYRDGKGFTRYYRHTYEDSRGVIRNTVKTDYRFDYQTEEDARV